VRRSTWADSVHAAVAHIHAGDNAVPQRSALWMTLPHMLAMW